MFNTFTCTSVINSKFICTLFVYVMYLSQLLRDGVFIVFFFVFNFEPHPTPWRFLLSVIGLISLPS